MNIGEFGFWVGVAITAAALIGMWKLSWQFIGSVVGDLWAAWKAYQAHDSATMTTYLDRVSVKGAGCTCLVAVVSVLLTIGALVSTVVIALTGHTR